MRRQLLVNGCLLVLALGTLGVVWATRDAPTTSELAARKDKLLPIWNKQAVTRLELRRPGARLELLRSPSSGVEGDFRIVAPWPERADIATVSALLGSLELATALRGAPDVSLAQAGLSTPSLEIHLEMSNTALDFALGGSAPAPPGARYARLRTASGTSQTYVVSQGLVSELDVPFDKFRETRLVEYGRSDIRELQVSSALGQNQLLQRDHGVFFVNTPRGSELADRARTERMLTALARLASEHFVAPELARSALATDVVKVLLRPKSDPDVTLTLGGACPTVPEQALALREQLPRSPKAGCIPRELVEAFRVSTAELVASTPFGARTDEVQELSLAQGATRLDLARKERAFVLRAPQQADVALEAGNELIAAIVGAKGQRELEPRLAALGLEPPAGEVTLRSTGDDAARTERLLLGKARADGSLCVKREADAVVLCLDAQAARAFQPDPALLKPLELLAVAPSDLAALSLDTPSLHQRVVRDTGGGYTLTEPSGFRHDGALVADVVQALGSLRAERWVAVQADGSHGLAAPRLRARLELVSGAPARELVVGAATRDGYFASLSPDPGVFVLARSALENLGLPLVDRSLCPFDEPSLERIELSMGARRVALTRRSDAWSGAGLDAPRAQALAETAVALRAELALHLGAPTPAEGFARPSLIVEFVAAGGKRARLQLGARTRVTDEELVFARLDGVDASFALALDTLRALQAF